MLNLGIIAGNGDLPKEIARIQQESGGKCFIASLDSKLVAQDEFNNPNLSESKDTNIVCEFFSLGSVSSIINFFKQHSVKEIVIIGGIDRPDLNSLKVDLSGSILLAKILKQKILGDDNILKIVSNYIESKGFRVISPQKLLGSRKYHIDIVTNQSPSNQDKIDIKIGSQILYSLGHLDVGQSVIVYNGRVIGIEGAEGTDNLISRCAPLRKATNGGVLVKMSKSSQDMRLDVPVIGPMTVNLLSDYNFNGIAIEKTGVIIANPEKTQSILNDSKLFLTALESN